MIEQLSMHALHDKPTLNIMLNGERLEARLPLRLGIRQGATLTTPIQ